ncbi:MAG: flagellar brake protein [Deltaproteobacteria bacterium]|nr:flagellar brake protein [Deltaproteobacteria bacterium]
MADTLKAGKDEMDEKMFDKGTRLALELGIRLKIELEGVDIPLESAFCGFVDNYIIISPPSPYHQIQHKLFNGAEMVVRYFYHGTIYAFQTKLFSQIEQPVRLLFIYYPKLIQKSELRSEKRSFCYLPAIVTAGDRENNGTVVDIAKSGCHFMVRGKNNKTLIHFKIGDEVRLNCKFPGVKQTLEIIGVVKNLRSNRVEANVGLQFNENTPDITQKIIAWYISTIEKFVPAHEVKLEIP